MKIQEALKHALDKRKKAIMILEASDGMVLETLNMAVRRAEIAEARYAIVEEENKKILAQLEEAWEAVAKTTDARS